ncbi:MAG: hypothetical protein ABI904_02530 [Chloroflexota bacterium]
MSSTKQKLSIIGLIVLGVLIVAFFGVRAVHAYRHIRDGGFGPGGHRPPPATETDVQLIRDWMTIPYIANTYGVPDRMLFKELKIPEENNREKSLKVLNDAYFPDQTGIVLEQVKQAITDHRPPAPPTAPSP